MSEAQLGGRGALGSLTTEGQAAEDGKRHDELWIAVAATLLRAIVVCL